MLLLKVFGTEFVENCFRAVARSFSDTNADENVAAEIKVVDQMIDGMEHRFLEEVETLRKSQETQEED
jgi:flagellar biosynthesis regulator FlbT